MSGVNIIHLGESYKGKNTSFTYRSEEYLAVTQSKTENGVVFAFEAKPLAKTIEKTIAVSWMEEYLENPQLFGAELDGKIVGYIEVSHVLWNNRLLVSNLFVDPAFRGRQIGRALMQRAEDTARRLGARAIVLETQSCNMPAIRFYCKMGFAIGGFDLYAYSNQDAQNKEVRIEMMKILDE